jgi:GFO/IDH/MocA oxidoreductase family protein
MKRSFAVAQTAAELDELLASSVDAVVLATPLEERALQAVTALEHGKAVFLRKPFTRDAQELQLIVDVARGNCMLLGLDLTPIDVGDGREIAVHPDHLFDAIDSALASLRYPRIERIEGTRLHVAGGRTIHFIPTDKVIASDTRALEKWAARLEQSKDFDLDIESVNDVARAYDAIVKEFGRVRAPVP